MQKKKNGCSVPSQNKLQPHSRIEDPPEEGWWVQGRNMKNKDKEFNQKQKKKKCVQHLLPDVYKFFEKKL